MVRAGWGADKGEVVVGVLELGVIGVDFVDEEGDGFVVFVGFDGPACRGLDRLLWSEHLSRLTGNVEGPRKTQSREEEEASP